MNSTRITSKTNKFHFITNGKLRLRKSIILLAFLGLLLPQNAFSQVPGQDVKISVNFKNTDLKQVLNDIEKKSDYVFMYDANRINTSQKVSIEVTNTPLTAVLSKLFDSLGIAYSINGKQIALNKESKKSVSGKVTDNLNTPLPGVSIVVRGKSTGTVTGADGSYTLNNLELGDILQYTFIGMKPQDINVGKSTILNVIMQEESIGLNEVVAVGYGVQKKLNLTGSVSTISSKDISNRLVGQASMALQGVAPGVTITQSSGQPGNDAGTIRIRGIGTLGDSNPLILVDGIPSDLNSIEVGDIENISVLKDAASSAIYGSRAANGVILVTTKRADKKKIAVSYKGYVGTQSPTDLPDRVSGLDHMLLTNESMTNGGQTPSFSTTYIDAYRAGAPSDLYPDVNWQNLTFTNDGMMQGHSFDVSGGNDLVMTRASFNYLKQNAIIPNTGFNRYSIRVNTDIKATEKLNFGIDITGRNSLKYEPGVSASQVFLAVNWVPQNMLAKTSTGLWGEGWNGTNPVSYANASGSNKNYGYSAIVNLKGEWKPFKGMSINVNWAPSISINSENNFTRTIPTYNGNGTLVFTNPANSTLTRAEYKTFESTLKAVANYATKFDKHNLNALVGFEQVENQFSWFSAYRENFLFEDYQVLSSGSLINQKANGSASEWGLQSYFGRVNYNYNEKYLLEANIRYDGSSRFATGNKWGIFPSFSAGWRVSEENFMKNISQIENLKVRASWGKLGNQNIGNYPFASTVNMSQYYSFNGALATGGAILDMSNENISWESSEMVNVGIDVSFLKKFSLTAEYYIKNTSGILLKLPIAYSIGLNAPYQNAGKVENKGWDVSLNYFDKIGDVGLNVTAVVSDVINKITDLRNTGPYISGNTIRIVGQPIDAFYGYISDGIFQTPEEVTAHATQFGSVKEGDLIYRDISGPDGVPDGKVSADYDRVIIGSAIPRYTFSLNLNATYKDFDLGVYLQGVGKANGYLTGIGVFPLYGGGSADKMWLDRWTPENHSTTFPRLNSTGSNNYQTSSYWMQDASYLRLKNLQLGYSLPKSLLRKTFLQTCRLYVSGENLLTFDNFMRGFDVESPVGKDNNIAYNYPLVKVYSVGLNIKF